METTITATELSRSLSDILSRVRYKGETFIVERNGEPVATLAPPVPAKRMTWGEFLEMMKELPPADPDFADDLEMIQASQQPAVMPRWDC